MLRLVREHPRTAGLLVAVQFAAVALCLALQRPNGPILMADEMGFLAGAWNLSTRDGDAVLAWSALFPGGYGVVLAPFLSVTPFDAWLVAVAVNVAMATMLPVVLWVVAVEHVDLSVRRAALIAGTASLYPAVLIQTARAWPEVMLALLVALWTLVAGRFVTGRTTGPAVAAGLIAGLSYSVHHRMGGLVAVTTALFVITWWRGSRPSETTTDLPDRRRPARLGLVATSIGFVASLGLDAFVKARAYTDVPTGATSKMLKSLLPGKILDTLAHVAGHAWYAQIAMLGLPVVVAALVIDRGRRRLHPGVGELALAGFVATLVISSMFLAEHERVDHVVYGRYAEIWAPTLIVVALAALTAAPRPARLGAAISGYTTVALAGALVAYYGESFFDRPPQKMTIPVAMAWDLVAGDRNAIVTWELDVWVITAAAVLVGVAVSALILTSPRWMPVIGIVFLTLGIAAAAMSFRPYYNNFEYAGTTAAEHIVDSGDDRYGWIEGVPWTSLKAVQYHSEYLPQVEIDPAGGCPDVGFIVAPDDVELAFDTVEVEPLVPFGGVLLATEC